MADWKSLLLEKAPDVIVAEKVVGAIQRLFERDADLLIRDAHEQTITSKLACYLQCNFPEWHVDCEYNRDQEAVKKSDEKTVKPDIIVHRRGKRNNLLVIEVKKSNNPELDCEDIRKLHGYREDPLQYKIGLFLKLTAGGDAPGVTSVVWVPCVERIAGLRLESPRPRERIDSARCPGRT